MAQAAAAANPGLTERFESVKVGAAYLDALRSARRLTPQRCACGSAARSSALARYSSTVARMRSGSPTSESTK